MESKQAMHYIIFYFLMIMFILCYWYYKKTGIVFAGNFNPLNASVALV